MEIKESHLVKELTSIAPDIVLLAILYTSQY
jgi:hypothetical protein